MEQTLIHRFTDELRELRTACASSTSTGEPGDADRFGRIAARTAGLLEYLARAPHTPASKAADMLEMDQNEMILGYKLIQRTDAAEDFIRSSPNRDYLNIVNHYFSNRMYVVVFFTGLACPGRCSFCPNVTVNDDGTRRLALYPGRRADRMSPRDFDRVFRDLAKIMSQGSGTLAKISGGLEPLTDPENMAVILDRAEDRGIRVKLFTNGILLDTSQRRRLALRARDVRISLSMVDEAAYADMMFGSKGAKRTRYGLPHLLSNLRQLVKDRDRYSPDTRIGLNTIVLEENYRDMMRFVSLATDIGLDYVDFKPNYFSTYAEETQAEIAEQVAGIVASRKENGTGIYFAGSLAADNLFWQYRDGNCSPHKQSRFKMFITPHGVCSPVHHGAFPSGRKAVDTDAKTYSIGRISSGSSLLDLIGNVPTLPGLPYDKLNPFEHMLALEIEREEQDSAWGIPESCNPYHFSKGAELPREIRESPLLH